MKLNEAFPSKYLTAADIEESGDLTVTIKTVEMVEMGQGADKERKLLLMFKGMDKGLVCNKTNATTISKVLGTDDTDEWEGQRIILKAMEVSFGNEMKMAIRVGLKKPAPAGAKPTQPHTVNEDAENF